MANLWVKCPYCGAEAYYTSKKCSMCGRDIVSQEEYEKEKKIEEERLRKYKEQKRLEEERIQLEKKELERREAERIAEEEKREQEIKEEKAKREMDIANTLISSGYSFEGYRIVKYSGYISGDDATFVKLPTLADTPDKLKDKILDAYASIRIQSLKELKEAAYDLGCNAVIGLDFDYMITDLPTNVGSNYPFVLSVTANGTAVKIEKE